MYISGANKSLFMLVIQIKIILILNVKKMDHPL